MNVEKIDSRYRLLHLIYEEKTSGILTDQNLRDSLNDLMKHELITIYNNKLRLTERGKVAMKNGIHTVLTKVKPKKQVQVIEDHSLRQLTELMVTIAVILLVILLFMLM